ncbi:LysR family transcriptional regulator [Rhodococcus sp. ACPA4]|uniref:LysR family transcriptional regulator n=1 Tax=Rhodococcus globerulus TaxID=33008 RepID=A0ABU4C1K2_RHOGO|nr:MULTISPECIES: LysR family transcriptional regulator [Rhodococcus]KJF24141.1 Cyn operon transcriptional activator [Rhodococcus sp. AD45]MDV6270376.1 LysR family transcriptional regulator [Rhodococcus globerulus]PBC43052.1 LysR family transcriptional regulator [Rhodococcus sp. ACPA4]PSR42472.1 LysR family transcriptional regulator [Rhodococcus sp. AD45-ID]
MDLHFVTYFVAVVDHGGITKAAQSLYISQPSLSQAIRTLERRLGATLFDRTGRRLVLTDAGRTFDLAARRILADVERAKAKVTAVRELEFGRVDVVSYSAFSIDPMVELVRRFRANFPKIVVRVLDTFGPAGVDAALRRGSAEVGVTDLSIGYEGLVTAPITTQEMVLATHVSLSDRLVKPLVDPVRRDVLHALPLVVDLGDQSNQFRSLLSAGAENVVVDCVHPVTTWELVRRGIGATVVPRKVAQQQMKDVLAFSFDPPLARDVGLVYRAGEQSPAAAAFIATVAEMATAAAGSTARE